MLLRLGRTRGVEVKFEGREEEFLPTSALSSSLIVWVSRGLAGEIWAEESTYGRSRLS